MLALNTERSPFSTSRPRSTHQVRNNNCNCKFRPWFLQLKHRIHSDQLSISLRAVTDEIRTVEIRRTSNETNVDFRFKTWPVQWRPTLQPTLNDRSRYRSRYLSQVNPMGPDQETKPKGLEWATPHCVAKPSIYSIAWECFWVREERERRTGQANQQIRGSHWHRRWHCWPWVLRCGTTQTYRGHSYFMESFHNR